MVDVLLINSPKPFSEFAFASESLIASALDMPPLSVLYLGTVLEQSGFSVEAIDLDAQRMSQESLRSYIEKTQPRIIGISTSTPTFPSALEIARVSKEALDVPVIMGGYHVTFLPEEALDHSFVDIVVRGEGESTLLELVLHYLHGGMPLDDIFGISYRKNGKIVHNPLRKPAWDLDILPYPNRDLLPVKDYANPGVIMSSRGCFSRCVFCAAGALASQLYRVRSPKNVVGEMYHLYKKYDFRFFSIMDNTFSGNPKRSMEICQLIRDMNLPVAWVCETRANVVDKNLLNAMAQAGCVAIQFGVESAVPRVLAEIKKGETIEQIDSAIRSAQEAGIQLVCSFMLGHHCDTPESIRKTLDYALELKRKGVIAAFGVSTPYPGTDLFNNREKYGVEIVDWDYRRWDTTHTVIKTRNLSRKDIEKLFFEAQMEINTMPRL